jgi:HK97 family phage prohead protease
MSEIEFRAAEVADVSYPSRTVTVIVAPYETPTVIHHPRGQFTEVVTRGAFDGVQRRAGSIRANRDHDWRRMAGRVTALHPERDEGLVAEVRMFKTVLGEETLELCADDGLSASAGFAPMRTDGLSGSVKPSAESWEGKTRRLNELWLDHVAFVPNPAYEGAKVIDVRDDEPVLLVARPFLERLRLEQARAKLAEIDARYGVHSSM